jgi:hypothetical protein
VWKGSQLISQFATKAGITVIYVRKDLRQKNM